MGTFKEILGKVFKNLGVEFYSTKEFFRKWFYKKGAKKETKEEKVL
jgi:hypothetical protein